MVKGLVLATLGCSSASHAGTVNGVLPSAFVTLKALDEDRVRDALRYAEPLARNVPSAANEGLLGLALWRSGELMEAEAHFRRAADTGAGLGLLGLAMAKAAQRHWSVAQSLASDAASRPSTAPAASALLAAMDLQRGDAPAARVHLETWARLEPRRTSRALANSAVTALGAVNAAANDRSAAPMARWTGASTRIDLRTGASRLSTLQARIGGIEVHLAVQLDAARSVLRPEIAQAANIALTRLLSEDSSERSTADARRAQLEAPLDIDLIVGRIPNLSLGATSLNDAPFVIGEPFRLENDAEFRNSDVATATDLADIDGILAADHMLRVRWSLDVRTMTLVLSPEAQSGPGATESVRSLPSETSLYRARPWIAANELAVQMFLLPRIAGRPVAALLDLARPSSLDIDLDLELESADQDGAEQESLPTFLVGLRFDIDWRRADLEGAARGGLTAPRATIGRDLVANLRLHWLPETGELALQTLPEPAPAPAPRGGPTGTE